MKSFLRPLYLAVTLLPTSFAVAQTVVDSAVTGPTYRDQVYYSLDHGVVATAALAEWDIAFELTGFSSSILTNGGSGVELYLVPNKTADDWAAPVDTTGMAGWGLFHNSTASWRLGAFNMEHDYNTGDFGWGAYNMVTHTVAGTALYVIKLPGVGLRKIKIDGLASGRYAFRYANLDGSNEVADTITKSDYVGKRFAYYSIGSKKKLDREPASDAWDMVFGKYVAMLGGTMPYGVSGVMLNDGVTVAEVKVPNAATAPIPSSEQFGDSITRIGHDWKSFTGGTYVVNDSLAFFVVSRQGRMYRVLFTGFSGSGTGTYYFSKTQLDVASVGTPTAGLRAASMALYPNDLTRGESTTLVYSLPTAADRAFAEVRDVRGALHGRADLATDAGLHNQPLGLDLASGIYFVTVTIDGASSTQKLIVR